MLLQFKFVNPGRCLSLQHHEFGFGCRMARAVLQSCLHSLPRQLRVVVFLTQMAKLYGAQLLGGIFGKGTCAVAIAQMAGAARYPVLQVLGVWPAH